MLESCLPPHPEIGVATEARKCLHQSPHALLRKITCEFSDGVLVLRGQVPSFYHKQLAQEAIVHVKGVSRVVNEIEVLR